MDESRMQVMAGLAEASLPLAVAAADRLLFHAGIYSNFARDRAMADALEAALARPQFTRLDVISFDPMAGAAYWDEFRHVLRQDMPAATMQRECAASSAFLDALANRHPRQVRLFLSRSMPLAPILIVGDTIYAGHYAHGPVPAPQGLWLSVRADVDDLLDLAQNGATGDGLDPVSLGAYRFVCECLAARAASRRLI